VARAARSERVSERGGPGPDPDRPYAGKSLRVRRGDQRERILLAARDVFATSGYAAAGIDEIVARARVSRTTFYEFFENKEKCLLAVFQLGVERVASALFGAVADAGELQPIERIRAEVRALAEACAADPAMARIILIEIVGATPACERARVYARDQAARVIQAQLEEYEYWLSRSPLQRRVASVAAMAAIGEPITELLSENRLEDQWETLVEPITEFVGRGLIDPEAW
jgi:AcrR family transcriptional regulator